MSQKNLSQTGSILEKGEESFHQSSDLKVHGMEILFFDHVELTKNEVGSNSFLEMGTLRVLYFPEYDRFILVLGNWEYALLKRLTITSSSKTDLQTRTFTFQTYHGLHVLKINKIVHPEALQNFETILSYTTKFSYFGEDVLVRRNEVSPDASLLENPEEIETEPSSSKSSFLRTNPEEGDPLSLHGKERIKRGFAKMIDKLSGNYFQKIGEKNLFLTQIMNFEDMKDLAVEFAPKHFFGRKEIELTILKSKDIASVMQSRDSPSSFSVPNRETQTRSSEIVQSKAESVSKYMIESLELLPYQNKTVTKEEFLILKRIEEEIEFQLTERSLQGEHRKQELLYIEKERELLEQLRMLREKERVEEVRALEKKLEKIIEQKDEIILKQARSRDSDLTAWELRENKLVEELRKRLNELKTKERMSEEDHREFNLKEKKLLEINYRLEVAKREAERQAQETIKETETRNAELTRREQLTAEEFAKFKEKERQLENDTQKRIEELKAKTELTDNERLELIEQQNLMNKVIALKELERIQIEQEQQILYADAARLLAELNQREMLTEAERSTLEMKEKELEKEHERILIELRMREFLTEEQRLEIEEREKELKKLSVIREAERVEFVRKQIEFQAKAEKREAELRSREQLTEKERLDLENMKLKFQQQNVIKEIELKEIFKRRNELLEEAEKREAEITKRLNLTEEEYQKLQARELEFEAELQRKLAELMFKEELTKYERNELEIREKELTKLQEIRQIEMKTRQAQLEKLKEHESELLKQNMKLIRGHKEMKQEIKELKNDLERPIEASLRETNVSEKEMTFEDVTQV